MELDYIKLDKFGYYHISIKMDNIPEETIYSFIDKIQEKYKKINWFISAYDNCLNVIIKKDKLNTTKKVVEFFSEFNKIR